MATIESNLKTYTVLSRLGWNGGTYNEGDTVEMEERFAEFYLEAKVLIEKEASTVSEIPPSPLITPNVGIATPELSQTETETET